MRWTFLTRFGRLLFFVGAFWHMTGSLHCLQAAEPAAASKAFEACKSILKQYCIDCHGQDQASGGVHLEQLLAQPDFGNRFKTWEKLISVLENRSMPPKDAPPLGNDPRREATTAIRTELTNYVRVHEGDPGPGVLRRLTSAEYAYTLYDLTGLDLGFEKRFVNDGVGGEGFTNVGNAQFVEDASLERYLEAAKIVADHAVIGAGPLKFFSAPGETGRELSAIDRISKIYRQHGFRTGAGEGAEPFGLELYSQAMMVAWQYRHRVALGQPDASLERIASHSGVSARLCQHLWRVLHRSDVDFPLSLIVEQWNRLPQPEPNAVEPATMMAQQQCLEIGQLLREWQAMLADAAGDEEEASVLTSGVRSVSPKQSLKADINWARGAARAQLEISVGPASLNGSSGALTVWRKPRIRFRSSDGRRGEFEPLEKHLAPESLAALAFGKHPREANVTAHDFVIPGQASVAIELIVPPDARAAQLMVDVELDLQHGDNRIVRCRLADGHVEGETAAETGATSTLLADPQSEAVEKWKSGVAQFAELLPEVSHREPAPSDRDPIPDLFDNTYNKPERNLFHTAIKYARDDRFLVEHILDDTVRAQLDAAWTDLLTSFDYHTQMLRFVIKKMGTPAQSLDPSLSSIETFPSESLDRMPEPMRAIVDSILREYAAMQVGLKRAEPVHVQDCIKLAASAWRRPLSAEEESRLRALYADFRDTGRLDHSQALRLLLARILVSPEFLYRLEGHASPVRTVVPLSTSSAVPVTPMELASRLSYFLWSSMPDEELRHLAESGQLEQPAVLEQQVRRMLRDPKARRMAAEFFGQWFGFYRFDEYRGIDSERFPEFTSGLQKSLYAEALSFFEYIIREDRPIEDALFADYTFLNAELSKHYALPLASPSESGFTKVDGLLASHRGGLLGLGAIHAVTSAPLRTSAVKRGDWVLRRIIGTPVPPPPADAGSISADDVQADGLTVRQRLERHRTQSACQSCHSRIDPLGFALEHFDPIGRWRDSYRDGLPVDSTGILADGKEIRGIDGLRDYLLRERQNFRRNFAGKLLGYAIGRAELASDTPRIDHMLQHTSDGDRFSEWVLCVVRSRQFQYRRL